VYWSLGVEVGVEVIRYTMGELEEEGQEDSSKIIH
jgi:hypothetical protein